MFNGALIDVGGSAAVAIFAIALVRSLLLDRSAFHEIQAENKNLEKRVTKLEIDYDEQRTLKHAALNNLAKCRLALDIVRRLQAECKCGALDPLADILTNLADHGDI